MWLFVNLDRAEQQADQLRATIAGAQARVASAEWFAPGRAAGSHHRFPAGRGPNRRTLRGQVANLEIAFTRVDAEKGPSHIDWQNANKELQAARKQLAIAEGRRYSSTARNPMRDTFEGQLKTEQGHSGQRARSAGRTAKPDQPRAEASHPASGGAGSTV
jgi:hypothetical protein